MYDMDDTMLDVQCTFPNHEKNASLLNIEHQTIESFFSVNRHLSPACKGSYRKSTQSRKGRSSLKWSGSVNRYSTMETLKDTDLISRRCTLVLWLLIRSCLFLRVAKRWEWTGCLFCRPTGLYKIPVTKQQIFVYSWPTSNLLSKENGKRLPLKDSPFRIK